MDRFAFGRPQTPTKPRLLEALSAANASTDETQSQSQNLNLNQSQNQNLNPNPNPTPSSPFWNRVFPWSVTVASAVAGSPKSPLRQVFMKAESEASARLAANKTLRRAHSALHAAPAFEGDAGRPHSSIGFGFEFGVGVGVAAPKKEDAEKDASPQIPPAAERHELPTKAAPRSPSVITKDEFFSPRGSPTSSFCTDLTEESLPQQAQPAPDLTPDIFASEMPRSSFDSEMQFNSASSGESPFLVTSPSNTCEDSLREANAFSPLFSTSATPRPHQKGGVTSYAALSRADSPAIKYPPILSLPRGGTPLGKHQHQQQQHQHQQQQQQQQQIQNQSHEPLVSFNSPVNSATSLNSHYNPASTPTAGLSRYSSGMMNRRSNSTATTESINGGNANGPGTKSAPTAAMYELHSVFSTPNSVPKYSERDVSIVRNELTMKFEKEFELLQLEIQDLDTRRIDSEASKKRMEKTLQEWEHFMKELIAKKEQDDAQTSLELQTLRATVAETTTSHDNLKKEHSDLLARHRQLRLDLEDEREASLKLVKAREEALEEGRKGEQRYEALKLHAEEKLESANVEIARVRAAFEKEIAALKVKITRVELHAQALERTVDTKTQENAELTKICDDLLMQIEGRS
ncbi:transforming acidic coiled-coil-containing protein-domain containing protein [Obelidium mucronatum]|nr:transforming acidic coiled-coil-containing protein-domain containing protein [Obelidium mucronatum]